MVDINRKLATLRRIAEVRSIEGADKIDAYRVDGWWVVSQKNAFEVGDLCVYFEIDSFLPIIDCFEFLRKGCFKSTKNLGDGFRLRTIKLKGQVSQGLIMPLEDFPEIMGKMYVGGEFAGHLATPAVFGLEEGTDVTELLGVKKYENPISSNLQGIARGNFPSFIPKTDQERYQNLRRRDLEAHKDELFELTIKYDGSSMTVYHNDGDFGVCSRNLDLLENDPNNFRGIDEPENTFWKVANKLKLKEILETIYKETGKNFAFQGELVGPGIQGNPMEFKDHFFFVFDIYDIEDRKYLPPEIRWQVIEKVNSLGFHIDHVNILYKKYVLGDTIFDFEYLMEGTESVKIRKDETGKVYPVEGLVFKNETGDFSFKIISNKYLLNERD